MSLSACSKDDGWKVLEPSVFFPAPSISEWVEDAGGQLFREQNCLVFSYSKKLAFDRTAMQLKWF